MDAPVPGDPAVSVDPGAGSPPPDAGRSAPAADGRRRGLPSAARDRVPAFWRDGGIARSGVGKGGVEPPRPFGHTDLNRARLPFRHLPWRGGTLAAPCRGLVQGSAPPPDRFWSA